MLSPKLIKLLADGFLCTMTFWLPHNSMTGNNKTNQRTDNYNFDSVKPLQG